MFVDWKTYFMYFFLQVYYVLVTPDVADFGKWAQIYHVLIFFLILLLLFFFFTIRHYNWKTKNLLPLVPSRINNLLMLDYWSNIF